MSILKNLQGDVVGGITKRWDNESAVHKDIVAVAGGEPIVVKVSGSGKRERVWYELLAATVLSGRDSIEVCPQQRGFRCVVIPWGCNEDVA
jgi:hypothetical protein